MHFITRIAAPVLAILALASASPIMARRGVAVLEVEPDHAATGLLDEVLVELNQKVVY